MQILSLFRHLRDQSHHRWPLPRSLFHLRFPRLLIPLIGQDIFCTNGKYLNAWAAQTWQNKWNSQRAKCLLWSSQCLHWSARFLQSFDSGLHAEWFPKILWTMFHDIYWLYGPRTCWKTGFYSSFQPAYSNAVKRTVCNRLCARFHSPILSPKDHLLPDTKPFLRARPQLPCHV